MEVPEPGIVAVLNAAVSPVDGVVDSVMAPPKPFSAVTMIVDVPEAAALMGPTVAGLADTAKSVTLTVTVTMLNSEPPVAFTMTE
jgi:hypothetical protein